MENINCRCLLDSSFTKLDLPFQDIRRHWLCKNIRHWISFKAQIVLSQSGRRTVGLSVHPYHVAQCYLQSDTAKDTLFSPLGVNQVLRLNGSACRFTRCLQVEFLLQVPYPVPVLLASSFATLESHCERPRGIDRCNVLWNLLARPRQTM